MCKYSRAPIDEYQQEASGSRDIRVSSLHPRTPSHPSPPFPLGK